MKILIISGFLGAGKTTFIRTMTEKTGRDFVVFENEYGQADIDTVLLQSAPNLNIWELTENCVCCTGKGDFASSILTISGSLDPEYLIVEPTGVARLGSIIDNIKQIQYDRISLLKPVTIIDVNCFYSQRKQFPDIYLDQIRSTSTAVLSKTGQASAAEIASICEEILAINPDAEVLSEPYERQGKDWWLGLLDRDLDPSSAVPAVEQIDPSSFETMSLVGVSLPSPVHLIAFLDALTAGVFGSVPRAKGYLPCGGQWLRFDVVERRWGITGFEETDVEAQCVFIGSDLYRAGLREVLVPELEKLHVERTGERDDDERQHEHDEHCAHHHDYHDHEHDGHCGHEHEAQVARPARRPNSGVR